MLLSLVGDMLVSVYRSEGGNGESHGLLFGGGGAGGGVVLDLAEA